MTSDRYNVPPSPGADLEQRLREMQEQIDALFNRTLRHALLPDGSIKILNPAGDLRMEVNTSGFHWYDDAGNLLATFDGASLRVYDDTGTLRARLGYISAGAGYGMQVFDAAGDLRSQVDDDGHKDPWLHSAFVPDPAVVLVGQRAESVSATFEGIWETRFQLVTHKGFAADVLVGADVGTAGEVRILGPDGNTSAISVTSAGGLASFRWLHTSPLGTGPALFKVQMRVTSGAGKVYSWWPTAAAMADPGSCDADGVP